MNTYECRDHRAPGFYALLNMCVCLARDNLPTVVIPVVAAGIGNPLVAYMETS